MQENVKEYWEQRWITGQTGWDIGNIAPAMKDFLDALTDKELRIVIPGCGNAYEGIYLHNKGFRNVYLLDIIKQALQNVADRCPDFPAEHLICADFFELNLKADLVIEQTFFCAIPVSRREQYAAKMVEILSPQGTLAGLLFDIQFEKQGPPFGGDKLEYASLFSKYFSKVKIEKCTGSIPPRMGSEVFITCALGS